MTLAQRGQFEKSDDFMKNTGSSVQQYVTDVYYDMLTIEEKMYPMYMDRAQAVTCDHWYDRWWLSIKIFLKKFGSV